MQDKLKRYVEDNRDEMEIYQPREYLWDGIEDRMQYSRKGVLWQRLAIAASLLLAVTCCAWIYMATQKDTVVAAVPAPSPLSKVEVYFAAIVQMKDAELAQYCQPQPELCREFEQDIEALNMAYHQLKTEYAAAADKEIVLQAMINNLQMQVQLMSRQLQVMEEAKQKKEQIRTI